MIITTTTIKQLVITDAPRLDPIRVMLENYEPGQGRITVTCWGRAWTAAWFAMSGRSIEQFVAEAYPEYVLDNMKSNMAPGLKRDQKREDAYLIRIIVAVQEALRQQLATPTEKAA